jgi:hypothetical protein
VIILCALLWSGALLSVLTYSDVVLWVLDQLGRRR